MIAPLPALLGGSPIRPAGPPDWPLPDDEVRAALERAFRDGSWGRYFGNYVPLLEERLRDYFGVPYALAVGSGTFAVELALRGLKVGPGDEVILAAYDYPGNFLSVHAVGARPVLVDVRRGGWSLDAERIAAAVTPQTRAIIASHLHGSLAAMDRISAIARAHGLSVVEDAAQSPGAAVAGRKAGSWGDVGILSFGGSKLLTAGRGGAVLTRHADVHQRIRLAMLRGNHICPLSELQAAALLPQLARLDERNRRRAESVAALRRLLADVPGVAPVADPQPDFPAYYKLGLHFDAGAFGLSRKVLVAALRAEGVAIDEGFRALHAGRSESRFRRGGDLAESDRAHAGTLVLHHPVLLGSEADMEQIAAAFYKVHAHRAALLDTAG